MSRRPGARFNRGRIATVAEPAAPPGSDVTAPTLVSAVINAAGTSLTLTYDEALDAASTPASGAFALGGTARTVSSVNVTGSTVVLTLSGVIGVGVSVTVSYTAGGAPIQDVAGNDAANLVAQAVTNNSTQDVTAPTLSSAAIDSAGTSLTLTYSEALDTGSTPANGAFSLAGTTRTVTGVNVTGSTVVLTLSAAVAQGATVTVSYTAGGAPIQDSAGNDAANLSGQAVTNNSTSDQTAPVLSTAIITAGGVALELTYGEALDTGSVPALGDFALSGTLLAALSGTPAVAGSKVTLTLAPAVESTETGITVSYTPGTNKIRDAAANNSVALTSQAVTNNSTHVFTPSDITGLTAWFDVSDAASLTLTGGNTTIADIKNKVSASVWDTPSSDTPYEATGLNGKPCLHPTTTSHRIQSTEAAVLTLLSNSNALTLYYYLSYDVADATSTVLCVCITSAGTPRRRWGHNTTGGGRQSTLFTNDAATTVTTDSGSDNTSTSGRAIMWLSSGTAASCSVNGAAADPNAAAHNPGTLTPTRLGLLAVPDNSADTPLVGRLGELTLFSGAHSAAQQSRMVAYLRGRWD
jgi:uncharacterized repeat protein (TIGR02059 family)